VLFPVHVVFLEFVIDPACAIVFEAEAGDDDAMQQPPRDPAQPLFDTRMVVTSLLAGTAVLSAVCAAYGWALTQGWGEGAARATAFAAIVFGNLALIIQSRSGERSLLTTLTHSNPALWWIVAGTLTALAAVLYFAPLAQTFRFAPLSGTQLLLALGAGIAGVAAIEVVRLLRRLGMR
jgi:Ca2+-transporting ATPase